MPHELERHVQLSRHSAVPISDSSPAANAEFRTENAEALALLCSPVLDPLFRVPDRLGANSAWWGHVPFAGWIMRAAQPRVFVELGTFSGVSYAAFCQAVLADRIACVCHAVDTWNACPRAGSFDETVYLDFKAFHDERFKTISHLHRCTFDEAQTRFDDGSVDLLHIDGRETCEGAQHDFQTWLPKMSPRGIILLHDTNAQMNGFGVSRFWADVSPRWPSFSFLHSGGLGVLCVGAAPPAGVAELCAIRDPRHIETVRHRFELLGDRWYVQTQWEMCLKRAAAAESRVVVAERSAEESAERARTLENSATWRITAPFRAASVRFSWLASLAQRFRSAVRHRLARFRMP